MDESSPGRAQRALEEAIGAPDAAGSERGNAARAGHIDVRSENGSRYGFGYAHLVWTTLNPSQRLVLHFSTHTVTVEGRNLRELYERVLRHEMQTLEGVGERHDPGEGEGPVVHRVHVIQKTGLGFGAPTESDEEASGRADTGNEQDG